MSAPGSAETRPQPAKSPPAPAAPCNKTRTRAVPGEAAAERRNHAHWQKPPAFNEDQQGRPFVGQAGQFLERLQAAPATRLKRSDVWIGNVVKCRPPNNRDPMPEELQACHAYSGAADSRPQPQNHRHAGALLDGQVLPHRPHQRHSRPDAPRGDRFVIAMFHPAAALHNPTYLPLIKQDTAPTAPTASKAARRELAKTAPPPRLRPSRPPPPPRPKTKLPKQMRLF